MSEAGNWVRFKKDFDHRATPRSVIAYKKGMHLRVPKAAYDAALAGGYAEEAEAGESLQAADAAAQPQEVEVASSKRTRG